MRNQLPERVPEVFQRKSIWKSLYECDFKDNFKLVIFFLPKMSNELIRPNPEQSRSTPGIDPTAGSIKVASFSTQWPLLRGTSTETLLHWPKNLPPPATKSAKSMPMGSCGTFRNPTVVPRRQLWTRHGHKVSRKI